MEEAEAPPAQEEPVLEERVGTEEVIDLDADAEIQTQQAEEAEEIQQPENEQL